MCISQAFPKRPKQSMEMKGQGKAHRDKGEGGGLEAALGGARVQGMGPGLGKGERVGLGSMAIGASACVPLCWALES